MVQSLGDVRHEILDILKPDRQAQQAVADAVTLPLFGRIGRVSHAGGMLNQGFGVTEAHRADNELEPVHEGHASLDAAVKLERNQPARLPHLAPSKLVLGKRFEAGISDMRDERVTRELPGDLKRGA